MAVDPSTLTTLSVAQAAALAKARGIVDAELRLRYDGQFPIKIRRGIIDFIFKENEIVLNTLIDEYTAAGWAVVAYTSDSQGEWFSFYPA